jgi:hypothetical protein
MNRNRGRVSIQCVDDRGHLFVHARDQRTAVAAPDEQPLVASKQTADISLRNLAAVVLGVDQPHARACDDNMIDVRTAARYLPIVQDDRTPFGESIEACTNAPLAVSALGPRLGRLRFIGHGEDETTQARMLRLHLLLPSSSATVELPLCRRTGAIACGRRPGSGYRVARLAMGRLGVRVPKCLCPARKVRATSRTHRRIPQTYGTRRHRTCLSAQSCSILTWRRPATAA